MTARPDDAFSLLVFARVVEARSFTAAATKLGLSKSMVSARVAQLEERLGVRLLHRTTRKLTLSTDGLALYERAARIASETEQATAIASSSPTEPRGTLRVNTAAVFAERYLMPAVAEYMAKHPRVRIELMFADRAVDLVEEGIDVAIRLSAGLRDSSLISRKLADDRTVVCASPEYIARRGAPLVPAELLHHDCLHYLAVRTADEWCFRAERRVFSVPIEARLEVASSAVLHQAALAGIGIAVLPTMLVAEDLARGRLCAVLEDFTFVRLALYAIYPSARVVPANVRAFVDIVAAHLRVPPWHEAGRRSS